MKTFLPEARMGARPILSTLKLACIAGAVVCTAPMAARAAGGALPSAITFDGHCDGMTHIKFHSGHTGTGTAVMTGTWDRSACGLSDVAAGGITGNDLDVAVTGTYDTRAAGVETIVLRIFYNQRNDWFSIDARGRVVDSGTWSAGAPGASGAGLTPTNVGANNRRSAPAAEVDPDSLPSDIHFDGYCDGITGIVKRRLRLQSIVTGTWNLEQCDGQSVPFTSMGNGDHAGGRDTVGTYDSTLTGDPVWVVEIFRNGTWIYRELDGTIFNQGTWSSGPPVASGPRSSDR